MDPVPCKRGLKRTEKYNHSIYLLSFSMGNIQINSDFYVRVLAYEKHVTGKEPLKDNFLSLFTQWFEN